jgi:acyl dehydratase
MPRQYGYGASMGTYVLDYIANWAGEAAYIQEADMRYSFPVLVGDVSYLRGEITDVQASPNDPALGVAKVSVVVTNQDGAQMIKATAKVAFALARP